MNDYENDANKDDSQDSPYRPNWQAPEESAGASEPSHYTPGGYGAPGSGYQNGLAGPPSPQQPYQYDFSEYDTGSAPGTPTPPKKGKKGLVVFFSIVGAILVISLASFAGYGVYVMMSGDNFIYEKDAASSPSQAASDAPKLDINQYPAAGANPTASPGELSNEAIAAKVSPSVVRISNLQMNYGIAGEGSGIIMNKEGYIITNAHVIEDADGIQISLSNDESYNATVIGTDVMTDLAVIKLEADPMPDLPIAEFGDSSQLVVGERVIAIGNAGGSQFASSVTSGIISALDRKIDTVSARLTVIQTDAAINPGNSGGALVNKFGQVVGINSAKFIKEGYEGLGFSIPINNAKPIVDDLLANGRVTGRPRLGIMGKDVNSVLAPYFGLPSNVSGVLVVSVDPACNIAKAGVIPGDVLVSMNGEPILSMSELKNNLISYKPGDTVVFEGYRPASQRGGKGKTYTVNVVLDQDTGETNFEEEESAGQEQQDPYGEFGGYGANPSNPYFPFY